MLCGSTLLRPLSFRRRRAPAARPRFGSPRGLGPSGQRASVPLSADLIRSRCRPGIKSQGLDAPAVDRLRPRRAARDRRGHDHRAQHLCRDGPHGCAAGPHRTAEPAAETCPPRTTAVGSPRAADGATRAAELDSGPPARDRSVRGDGHQDPLVGSTPLDVDHQRRVASTRREVDPWPVRAHECAVASAVRRLGGWSGGQPPGPPRRAPGRGSANLAALPGSGVARAATPRGGDADDPVRLRLRRG